MDRPRTTRRRPEAPSAPTTLTEITRRYYACAVALAKAMGVPMSETFLREHRESISCCFIEAGRAGVRLPSGVQLPPLPMAAGDNHLATGDNHLATSDNGGAPDAPTTGQAVAPVTPPDPEAPAANAAPPPKTTAPAAAVQAGTATNAASLPTSIPAGLQLPCAEALITDLRPPQLSLLIGKVGLRALADTTLEPLHVALLAERARRFEEGRKATPVREGR